MVLFYAEVLRSIGFRDNNFKPLASNNPAIGTISWVKANAIVANSDGDILTFSNSTANNTVNSPAVSLSTTTYPYIVVRLKSVNGGTVDVVANYTVGTHTFPVTPPTTGNYKTFTLTMTTGKTFHNVF